MNHQATDHNQTAVEALAMIPVRFGAQIAMSAAVGLKCVWDEDPTGADEAMTLIECLADHAPNLPAEDLREVIRGVVLGIRFTQQHADNNVPAVLRALEPSKNPGTPRRVFRLPDTSDVPASGYLTGYLIASLAANALKNAWLGDREAADNTVAHIEGLTERCDVLPSEDLRGVIDGMFAGTQTSHRVAARNLPVTTCRTG